MSRHPSWLRIHYSGLSGRSALKEETPATEEGIRRGRWSCGRDERSSSGHGDRCGNLKHFSCKEKTSESKVFWQRFALFCFWPAACRPREAVWSCSFGRDSIIQPWSLDKFLRHKFAPPLVISLLLYRRFGPVLRFLHVSVISLFRLTCKPGSKTV